MQSGTITATTAGVSSDAKIGFEDASLANADLSGSTITATGGDGSADIDAKIDFDEANLVREFLATSDVSGTLRATRRRVGLLKPY